MRAACGRALALWAAALAALLGDGAAANLEAEAVVFFHRHGDRTPTVFLPNDSANSATWTEMGGPGMLTPQGMAQLERLGAAFRERYVLGKPFRVISGSYKHGDYVVRTTDFDRTQQSAQSFLHGFFPPGTGPRGGLRDHSQPVPTTIMPSEIDSVLAAYSGHMCPRARELREAAMSSEDWRARETANQDLLQRGAAAAGFSSLSLRNVSLVADALLCDRANNLTWIEPFRSQDPTLFDDLFALSRTTLRPAYASSKELSRLGGGNMLAQVVSRFQAMVGRDITVPLRPTASTPVLNDASGTKVPIAHYSAHDSTLIALLGAIGAFDDVNPPYGSTVVFELLRDPASSTNDGVNRYVRVFYNKGCAPETLFEAPLTTLCEGKTLCTLDEFIDAVDPVIPKNYALECRVHSNVASLRTTIIDHSSVGVWIAVVSCGIIVGFASHRLRKSRDQPQLYNPV